MFFVHDDHHHLLCIILEDSTHVTKCRKANVVFLKQPQHQVISYLLNERLHTVKSILNVLIQLWVAWHLKKSSETGIRWTLSHLFKAEVINNGPTHLYRHIVLLPLLKYTRGVNLSHVKYEVYGDLQELAQDVCNHCRRRRNNINMV